MIMDLMMHWTSKKISARLYSTLGFICPDKLITNTYCQWWTSQSAISLLESIDHCIGTKGNSQYKYESNVETVSIHITMPSFSKFITSQRGCQQLVDSDGYIYSNKKSYNKETSTFWRCSKYNPPVKCKVTCKLFLPEHHLVMTDPSKTHDHAV